MSDDSLSGIHLETEEDFKVYELGYHLVPTVPEELLLGEVQKIKDAIVVGQGTFVSEDSPKLKALAYPIIKHVAGANVRCDRTYFGWVKFIMRPEALGVLKDTLDRNEKILRYLLIKTVKESTLYSGRHFGPRSEGVPIQAPKKIQKEEISATTMAEIDKTIEELVIE